MLSREPVPYLDTRRTKLTASERRQLLEACDDVLLSVVKGRWGSGARVLYLGAGLYLWLCARGDA